MQLSQKKRQHWNEKKKTLENPHTNDRRLWLGMEYRTINANGKYDECANYTWP